MRFITGAVSATLLAHQVLGHPYHLAPRKELKGRSVDLNAFRLTTDSTYSNVAITQQSEVLRLLKRTTPEETASALVKSTIPDAEFRLVPDHYVGTNGVSHFNFKQTVHGLDIDNADFNVNIAKDGSVLSFGNSFFTGATPSESPLVKRDQVDPVAALKGASDILGLSVNTDTAKAVEEVATEHYVIEGTKGAESAPKARLVYLQTPDNTISLTWRVETDVYDDWLLTYVNAAGADKVLGVVNYVADASYQVYPWEVADPSFGSRTLETNPYDTVASEYTWQNDGTTTYTVPRGNNGIAQANYEGDTAYINDYRPSATGANFNYDYSPTWSNYKTYSNASVTQIFYTSNMYHDLLHTLGFNEAAGNFEVNNHGSGGLGNDAVILNAQDGSGTNNANFATPVDGQAPRMRMFMWTTATPNRDCAFDAKIVIHEYTHGVSNRLTGGPANAGCLSVYEAGGMGEGWGDFMATAIHTKPNDTRAKNNPMSAWTYNKAAGIRAYPYSTSLTTNPLTYKYVNTYAPSSDVHSAGTVWATMLYEVMWNLIEKHGINAQRKPTYVNGVPTDGRFLIMQLVIDGMKLQPCSPTFITARDAILDADEALTGGANACEIWKGFAKRGLGSGASRGTGTTGRTENFVVPTGVC